MSSLIAWQGRKKMNWITEVEVTATGKLKSRRVKDQDFRTLSDNILLLSQKARSAGIHLLLASQRFSVGVLKGDAQANFPVRLCLRVARPQDSK